MPSPSNSTKMQLSRNQIESLYLAGTVSIPRNFPDLGRIWFWPPGAVPQGRKHGPALIRVEQKLSLSVTVTRSCLLDDVAAIFLPEDPKCVEHLKGTLVLGHEIEAAWAQLRKETDNAVQGIVYVAETARVLTEITMGMSAVQSVDYVPPIGPQRLPEHYALPDVELYTSSGMKSFCDPSLGCQP